MVCPSCGANLRDNAIFCSSCGQRITQQTIQTRIPPREERAGWDTSVAAQPAPEPTMRVPPQPGSPPAPGSGQAHQQAVGGPAGPGAYAPGRAPGSGASQFGGATPLGGARTAPAGPDFGKAFDALGRLLRFDTSVFRALYGDQTALIPSLMIAGVALFLMGLGGWLWTYFKFQGLSSRIEIGDRTIRIGVDTTEVFVRSTLVGTITGLAVWVGWVFLSTLILQQMFRRRIDFVSFLPSAGLAAVPFAFALLMAIDHIQIAIGTTAVMAGALLMQIALQETSDATPGEAFIANAVGFLAWAIVLALLGDGNRNFAPGIWGLT